MLKRAFFLATMLSLISSCNSRYSTSTYLSPDTRAVQTIYARDSVAQAMKPIFDSLRFAPSVETGVCFYGGIAKVGEFTILELAEATPAPDDSATAMQMKLSCPQRSASGLRNIGYGHTHPTISDPSELCFPSTVDMQTWIHYYTSKLIMFVWCQNGFGYQQLRDGRWVSFRWYTPQDGTFVKPA